MRLTFLGAILLFLSVLSLQGQSIWIKGYGGIGRGPYYDLSSYLTPESVWIRSGSEGYGFLMPAIVLKNSKNDNFWEIGGTGWRNNSPNISELLRVPPGDSLQFIDVGAVKSSQLQLALEYNTRIMIGLGNKWSAYLGFALNPHWSKFDFKSHRSFVFSSEASTIGLDLGLVPRLQYQWTKNLVLDFNAGLFLLSADYETSALRNPALTLNQQTSTLIEFSYLERLWVRVGLAYRIFGSTEDQNN